MRLLPLSACILALAVAVSAPVHAQSAWAALSEDAWLLRFGAHPCDGRRPHCSDGLRQIFDRLIEAHSRGDERAMERWRKRLYLYYVSNPEQRPLRVR